MKRTLLKVLLFSALLMLCFTFTAIAENYEEQFNNMDIEELEAISQTLTRIINEKKIGNAVLIVDPVETLLAKGKTIKLSVTSDGRTITSKTVLSYESSNENIAKVNNGIVTGIGEGKATIKISALFEDGVVLESNCNINVFIPVTSISAPIKANTLVGGELNLAETISVAPANATEKKLKYSIDNESIATIDENGILKGIKGGIAKVTVESIQSEPVVKKLLIEVSINEAVGTITLDKTNFSLGKGKTEKLAATVGPESASNKLVEWKSEDPNIASVSSSGIVTGKANGTTKIICTAKDGSGVFASADVTVIIAVNSVKIHKANMVLMVGGKSETIQCEVLPKDATDKSLSWKSSNSTIVSVDSNGNITGKTSGKATITATSNSDNKKVANVTVYVEPSNPVSVNYLHWQTMWGQKNGKMGVHAINLCTHRKIKAIELKIECTNWFGNNTVTDYVTFTGLSIAPGKEGKTKLTRESVSGFSTAGTVKVTPIAVTFDDGTYYAIPVLAQEYSVFSP